MPCVHLLIKGKVQGVFFRVSGRKVALENNLTGWIKNAPDGDVEIETCGKQNDLDTFINWCKKGPDRAVVTSLLVTKCDNHSFDGFAIRKD